MLDITPYFWLLLIATVVAMVARRFRLPYAIALVVTGVAIGQPRLLPHAQLEPHTLFTVFLPPLLFEAAIQLHFEELRERWRTIALFALFGTVISAAVVGGLTTWLVGIPLLPALVFGALTAPTDPISVIAVFKRLGVGKKLTLIVEAESLFNDGVAVVLFGVLAAAATGGRASVPDGFLQFAVVVLGGTAVGLGIGWVASRVTQAFDDHLLEIMLTTIVAWGSYLGAEAVHVSGVIAVVAAGLMVGNYGMPSGMSPTTRMAVSSFWEYAAFAANSLVFLLIGIEVSFVNLWADVPSVLGASFIVLVGRAAAVYVLAPIAARSDGPIPGSWRHVLFWGGLRGALSMALALGLPRDFPNRETLVVLTFGVVLFSLLIQGLSIGGLLKRLGLRAGDQHSAEFQRLVALRLASLGALEELERRAAQGTVGREEVAEVQAEYERRLRAAEEKAAALHEGDPRHQRRREAAVRRMALLAERCALQDAESAGLIDSETMRPLLQRINGDLARLQSELHEH